MAEQLNPDVLTSVGVARLLGITYKTFLKRKALGDVPPPMNRVGRPLWHRETVEAWMRRAQTQEVA